MKYIDQSNMDEIAVLGIVALYHNIKGILIYHYKGYTNSTPPVLLKKLNELSIHAAITFAASS